MLLGFMSNCVSEFGFVSGNKIRIFLYVFLQKTEIKYIHTSEV